MTERIGAGEFDRRFYSAIEEADETARRGMTPRCSAINAGNARCPSDAVVRVRPATHPQDVWLCGECYIGFRVMMTGMEMLAKGAHPQHIFVKQAEVATNIAYRIRDGSLSEDGVE